ncbi:unnamed protein product [Didymodactylos carnosus]|uniref:Hexosyltransferase n=1 Tax=Didymodactylos carnosus TaxID=1234261 RepID=A0A8S2SBW0_9BILA|nr:unnamed protein product [Didymodactylos carnosus]CAF4218809.1 unnamed protein product [Didymodactylos carnosus]
MFGALVTISLNIVYVIHRSNIDMNSFHKQFRRYLFYMNSLNLKNRRRLKRLLIFIIAFIIVALLIDQKLSKGRLSSSNEVFKTVDSASPSALAQQARKPSVFNIIQFTNPTHLVLNMFEAPFVPIIVLSKAANVEVRDAIRRTWGFERLYNDTLVKTFFLVGTDDFMIQRLKMEQLVFDDIIQVSVPDLSTFSAYKELAAMYWVKTYLPTVEYYVKTEEDTIINTPVFVNKVLPHVNSQEQLIYGWFGSDHIVKRNPEYQKFVDAVVPPTSDLLFAMNLCYIITAVSFNAMLDTLKTIELIEYPGDPFITGILRDAAKVRVFNFASDRRYRYEMANGKCKDVFITHPNLILCTSSLHVGSSRSMPEYFETWEIITNQTNLFN